ncbi:hypothetical protein vseg_011064 [Gypsophila vaccaria]
MARELQTLLLATSSAWTLQTLCERIDQVKKILNFIGEFPEWINHNRSLEERLDFLRRKTECLEHVQADVETLLENTELQTGKKRKREVDHWLTSVKQKVDDVSKIETGINSLNYLPRFLFRAWLGSCIGDEIQVVTELQEQGKFPEGLLLDAPWDGGERFVTGLLVGQTVHEKIDEIWSYIHDPEIIKIGVQGGEGIGKTAIMIEIYNGLRSSTSSSNRVYYVNVPQNFSTYSLQSAIASAMKVTLPPTVGTENRRAARLFNSLKSINKYILILDGVSEHFTLEEVGIPAEGNAGKLVLTSQSSDVCRRMLCHETVVLQRLPRDDSETLFMEKLSASTPLCEEMREVARHVVQKCNGVPLKIIDMAVQLRGVTDVNEWRSTLNDM